MKKFIYKISRLLAVVAIMATAFNVNSACLVIMHQPDLPENAKKLRRLKCDNDK